MSRFIGQWLKRPVLDAVDRLWPIAEEAGLTMAQLCLAWVLRQDNVAAAIVGASRPEQVHENARAADVRAERRHAARDRRGAAARRDQLGLRHGPPFARAGPASRGDHPRLRRLSAFGTR